MKIKLITLFIALYNICFAQFHLDEIGMQIGGGTNLASGAKQLKPSYAYDINAFYSHYRCGKRDGYHFEFGARGFRLNENAISPALIAPISILKRNYHFMFLDLGAFFKIRPKDYHRNKETALLIGPKLNVRLTSFDYTDSLGLQRFNKDEYRKLPVFNPGFSLSLWIRRPYAAKKSYFIRPGVEYYFGKTVKTESGLSFNSFNLFLNFGFIFWDNK